MRHEDVLTCYAVLVFFLMFLPVQGQCFIDIWRLKFGICAVSGTFVYCDVEYWLLRGVLA